MATPRDIRRLAFQALYQLDARVGGATGASAASAPSPVEANPEDAAAVLAGLLDDPDDTGTAAAKYTPGEIKKAFLMASGAFSARAAADAFMTEAAPTWPAHRQAAVDRAILRLAHYEMMLPVTSGGGTHPKIVVNEAVELAKDFSTEKSPAFVNGLLDKLLKQVLKERGETADSTIELPAAANLPTETSTQP